MQLLHVPFQMEVLILEKTKYPVVLVHGMGVKDFSFFPAFRGITDFLKTQGVSVFITNQDAMGCVATNAAQLKAEIEEILKKEKCKKVNLIAHSKGGVDARYLISHLDMAEQVASLTTLSTPHHGSGLSSALLKMPRFLASIIAFFTNTLFRILGDAQPDIWTLGQDLSRECMAQFNECTPDAAGVYYQSFSSTTSNKKAFLRFVPYEISRYCEQDDTDGMVSVTSSRWGNYRGSMGENIDHFEMVGVLGSKQKITGVGLFYLHIIQELQAMGF